MPMRSCACRLCGRARSVVWFAGHRARRPGLWVHPAPFAPSLGSFGEQTGNDPVVTHLQLGPLVFEVCLRHAWKGSLNHLIGGFSGDLPVAAGTKPHSLALALLAGCHRPVRQQQLIGVAGLLSPGRTPPARRPGPAHQAPLPGQQVHAAQGLQRPQHAARVALPVFAEPPQQGLGNEQVERGQPPSPALQVGARLPGAPFVSRQRPPRPVAEHAVPSPRAGMAGIGQAWGHAGTEVSGAGGNGVCVGQSNPFLGWTKVQKGAGARTCRTVARNGACKTWPDRRPSECSD